MGARRQGKTRPTEGPHDEPVKRGRGTTQQGKSEDIPGGKEWFTLLRKVWKRGGKERKAVKP